MKAKAGSPDCGAHKERAAVMSAEKFQAMVNLGELNSRMKDFYDIWLMSRQANAGCRPHSKCKQDKDAAEGTR